MTTNRYANRRIKATIYQLKRLYGGTIFLYDQGTPSTNIETGVVSWPNRQVTKIKRAIVLPVKLERVQTQGISLISSGKEFVYGGMYDKGSRWFYIDPDDLSPGYEIKRDDWIVYHDTNGVARKYEIKDINNTEFTSLWQVLGVELPGVVPEQIHLLSGHTIIEFNQTSEEDLN